MELWRIFPVHMREWVISCMGKNVEEFRIRVGQPVEIICREWITYGDIRVIQSDIDEMVNYICNYSPYAYKEQMRQGFITIEGGHRIGIAGSVVMADGCIKGFSHITFLNIRVAGAHTGCADKVAGILTCDGLMPNTLIFSAPGMGKTTLLRDLIRIASDRMKVCVLDERSEIAACHLGVPQNDVGCRTDVLDGCSKPEGVRLMIRAMSPQLIALDELGACDDYDAVMEAVYAGCALICTVHAGSMQKLQRNPHLQKLIKRHIFSYYIHITKREDGERSMQIFDRDMKLQTYA